MPPLDIRLVSLYAHLDQGQLYSSAGCLGEFWVIRVASGAPIYSAGAGE